MAKKKEKWMKEAFAGAHGQYKARAKRKGMSTKALAAKESKPGAKVSSKIKKEAVLAKTGMKYGGKGRKKRKT